tara:strand:- start:1653 stop:2345 length:693 start_codon:yes stop_codon:yes gene_type:complete
MEKLILQYDRDGYILLKNCISKNKCNKFLSSEIYKKLKRYKIDSLNKKTYRNRKELIITDKNKNCPLSKDYKNWNEFFQNKKLINFFNKLHRNKWNFFSNDLGWIHLRFPFYKSLNIQFCNNWHIDGMNNNFLNYKQGEVILPMITKVNSGGGGTIILNNSHKFIEDYVNSNKRMDIFEKIDKLSNKLNKIEITCNAGDILIMHPFLIHSSSFCNKRNRMRVFFNLCLQK